MLLVIIPTLPFIGSFIAVVLAFFLWQRREATGATELAFVSLTAGIWTFAYGFELFQTEIFAKIFWAKFSYLGIATLPIGWFFFCLCFSGVRNNFLKHRLIFFILPLITISLTFTNEHHELIWRSISLNSYQVLQKSYGWWFWVHTFYSYSLLASGSFTLLFRLLSTPVKYRGQITSLFIGLILPTVGNFIYLSGIFRVIDLSPVLFIVSFLIIAWGMFRYSLFDLVPVARSVAVEQMNEGILVLDNNSRVLDINTAASSMLALPAKESLVGLTLKQFSPQLTLTKNPPQTQRVEINKRVIEFKASVLKQGKNARGQILVLVDITKQAETEQKLREAKIAAEFASSAQSNFLTNISHELNTPLTAMIGFSELVQSGFSGPINDTQKQYLTDVIEQGHNLKKIIQKMLSYSHLETSATKVKLSTFELKNFLENLFKVSVKQFSRDTGNTNNFELLIDNSLGTIHSDQDKVQQIIYQLLDNANKFTKDGKITLNAKRSDNSFAISIHDTGIGIAEEHLQHIFTSFMQVDNSQTRHYGGNGLGLAICKRYASILGGKVVADSKLGKGTVFTLYLPVVNEEQIIEESAVAQ